MNEVMRRFVKGLIMGRNSVVGSIPMAVMLAGKHKQEEQTPIAYLYNGVQLPPLPEWDKEKYPYAYIVLSAFTNEYRIYTTNKAGVYAIDGSGFIFSENNDVEGLQYNHVDGAWVYVGTHNYNLLSTIANKLTWSNTDIINSDGTLYLSASDPIPVYNAEPVAYLYNGVRLPKLPEWDREEYPWAVIIDADNIACCFFDRVAYAKGNRMYIPIGTNICHHSIHNSVDTWEFDGEFEWDFDDGMGFDCLWSSYDLLNEDGTVYIKASNPVPVYE